MITSLLLTALPAFAPAISDAIRGIIGKITGTIDAGAKPQNVDEQIRLWAADTERLKVLATLDTPSGNISPWVANLRASFRYIAAGAILLAAIAALFMKLDSAYVDLVWQAAQSAWSFIFGDRMYSYIRRK